MTDAPFSVVICTLDRPVELARALRSVLADAALLRELWVMDQSAGDDTGRMIRAAFPDESRLRHVRLSFRNKSRAANAAARAAGGAFLAFTDDDCEVKPGWLAALKSGFDRHPCAAVAGGIESAAVSPGGPEAVVLSVGDFRRLGFCGGGNVAVRKGAYLRVGGLDEAMGPGTGMRAGEDLDLFYRLLVAGGTLLKAPEAVVRHHAARLADPADRRRAAHDYARGAAAFHLKHLRCGDLGAARGLWRYVAENIGASGGASAFALLYALRHAAAPLRRETRMYAAD